ncbi:hypothetical protein G169_gp24 [Pseudomonas phage AF]|uniref:hypothetical protein n=1 Tax=Pseudomonas phage AF TaxID=1235689 RepID=UPI0002970EEA|nr:hypothetical protein G169_gp24 [Pseudomonas phage AF]AFV50679.1 hypothetical protein AF_024 [Pseudomonas phage AF]
MIGPSIGMTGSEVQAMIEQAMASGSPMTVMNQAVAEGQTVTIPNTNNDVTLNLETGGAQLNAVTINLPGNSDGRVGQRVFVNSDGQIALAHFQSSITVNGADYMFNPGDNCVFYRNKPAILSRITA